MGLPAPSLPFKKLVGEALVLGIAVGLGRSYMAHRREVRPTLDPNKSLLGKEVSVLLDAMNSANRGKLLARSCVDTLHDVTEIGFSTLRSRIG